MSADNGWQPEAVPFKFIDRDLQFYGESVVVTPQQAKILRFLAQAGGEYVDRDRIADALGVTENTVKVQMCFIRKRMGAANVPCPVQTRYGFGMRWNVAHMPLPAFESVPALVQS